MPRREIYQLYGAEEIKESESKPQVLLPDHEHDERHEERCHENNGHHSYTIRIADLGCVLKRRSNNYAHYHEGPVYFRDVDLAFILGRCVDNLASWETSQSH